MSKGKSVSGKDSMAQGMMLEVALQEAMAFPLAFAGEAKIYAVPAGWVNAELQSAPEIHKAHSGRELEDHIRQGRLALYIPSSAALTQSLIEEILQRCGRAVSVFMEPGVQN